MRESLPSGEDVQNRNEKRAADPFGNPVGGMVQFTMQMELKDLPPDRQMPFGYRVEAWCEPLLPAFAAAMAVSFSDTPELRNYPDLKTREGCLLLMKDLVSMPAYLTGASWLAFFNREPCAFLMTSQTDDKSVSEIKVMGVAPRHRGLTVGSTLAIRALWALRDRRYSKVIARVNRANRGAVRFFRHLGFQVDKSLEYM